MDSGHDSDAYHRAMREHQGIKQMPQTSTKPTWNPKVFYALAILCGFGAAGILAGINYRRLGKPLS